MKGKNTISRITLVLALAIMMSAFIAVNKAEAAVIDIEAEVAIGKTLLEGQILTKAMAKKVVKTTAITDTGKTKKKYSSWKLLQAGKVITPNSKGEIIITLYKGSKDNYDVATTVRIKVNTIKDIYIKSSKMLSAEEGKAFDEEEFRKKTVVMAEYANGRVKRITTYNVDVADVVSGNKNGNFSVKISYGKGKKKISDKIAIPTVPAKDNTDEQDKPDDNASNGSTSNGSTSNGSTSNGSSSGGSSSGGSSSGGSSSGGSSSGGSSSGGNTPGGNTPGGNTPGGNTPGGNTPGGNTPGGNTPGGNTPEEPKTVTVTYAHSDGKNIKSATVKCGDGITPPTGSILYWSGRIFKGWKLGNTIYYGGMADTEFYSTDGQKLTEDIKKLTSAKQNVNIVSYYEEEAKKYYSVTIKNGTVTNYSGGDKDDSGKYSYNTYITITPEEREENFAGWINGSGSPIVQESYSFWVTSDITLEATYSAEVVEAEPVVSFTGNGYDIDKTNKVVTLHMNAFVPQNAGYTVEEWGYLYTSKGLDENTMIVGQANPKQQVNDSKQTGEWTVDMVGLESAFDIGKTMQVCIYLKVKKNGVSQPVIYSEIIAIPLSST